MNQLFQAIFIFSHQKKYPISKNIIKQFKTLNFFWIILKLRWWQIRLGITSKSTSN